MDFFIRQNATLPLLIMELSNDSRVDYRKFYSMLENASITFSMIDSDGSYKIFNKSAFLVSKPQHAYRTPSVPEYYICYKFCPEDTDVVGKYKAEFRLDFLGTVDMPYEEYGILIAPIKEDLYVYIKESFTLSEAQQIHC